MLPQGIKSFSKSIEFFAILDWEEEKLDQEDELSENIKKLVDFAKSVPDDKAELVLKLMRTIVEDDR